MLFTAWQLGGVTARNRLVRSATYEGLADDAGRPTDELGALYARLADGEVGTIITGFCSVCRRGRAMQPRQCGIDTDDKIDAWSRVVAAVRSARADTVLIMQLAHAGLQTLPEAAGGPPLAPSVKRSPYFRATPVRMAERDVRAAVSAFAAAAVRARRAGFDGVQLHAAHGYLIHQFLSPCRNRRSDAWGGSVDGRFAFLREIVAAIRAGCGGDFAVLVKLSVPDGHAGGVDVPLAIEYVRRMRPLGVGAVEISTGTMDLPLNIFRGGAPVELAVRHNPLLARRPAWQRRLWKMLAWPRIRRRLLPFSENYNRAAAAAVRRAVDVPVILVGGVRRLDAVEDILAAGDADAVGLCRPLIRQPELGALFRRGQASASACINCNACAVMCDSRMGLRCYGKGDDNA